MADAPSTARRRWTPPAGWLLWLLLFAAAPLMIARPMSAAGYFGLIDLPTLSALAGLLICTTAIERSGLLQRLAADGLGRIRRTRSLALGLVLLSAALAALLTNDVSLFLLVPLTLGLGRLAHLPIGRLVTLEALAVNAGSALTPIGNPQNLFIWQSSGIGALAFVHLMAPAVAIMLSLVLLVAWLSIPAGRIELRASPVPVDLDRGTALLAAPLFLGLLLLLADGRPFYGLALAAGGMALLRPRLLRSVDWTLLLIIALMFIDLRLLASLPAVHDALRVLTGDTARREYVVAVLLSQFISNVPATIALHGFVTHPAALLYGVNVGGFGTLVGSLANLIALRLARGHLRLRDFHALSMPVLAVAALAVWILTGV